MSDQLTPDTLRVWARKRMGWGSAIDYAELSDYADARQDDILRQDVYDENYRLEREKNVKLQAQVEALARDAARYRWFRNDGVEWLLAVFDGVGYWDGEDLDTKVDAFLAKATGG